MYDLQLIESRIMSIAKEMGLSKNKLLINTNLNKSVFDNMKKGQIPSVDKIHILADYLNVSVDYLLGRDKYVGVAVQTTPARPENSTANEFTAQEIEFIKDLRSLDLKDKFEVMKALNNAKERREFPESAVRSKEA